MSTPHTVIAFAGHERIAAGDIAHVTAHVTRAMKRAPHRAPILVFDAVTGDQIAQLSFVILGYHRHCGTRHGGRRAALLNDVLLPETG